MFHEARKPLRDSSSSSIGNDRLASWIHAFSQRRIAGLVPLWLNGTSVSLQNNLGCLTWKDAAIPILLAELADVVDRAYDRQSTVISCRQSA